LKPNDILIVSVGGNDIALQASCSMMYHIGKLLYLTKDIKKSDSFKYLIDVFKTQVESYINELTVNVTPKKIIICSVYYPSLSGKGWADKMLSLMDYKKNHKKIHSIIRCIYEEATSKIKILFSDVITVPLYNVLDYQDQTDYVARVEPSSTGGYKMAKRFINELNL
jgi:hypothetical protein